MSDAFHRVLTGNTLSRRQLIGAGVFVLVWFAMDVIQFADFVMQKFASPPYTGAIVTNHPCMTETGCVVYSNVGR